MKLKLLVHKWELRLKELKDAKINETNFKIKIILAQQELVITEFLHDIYEE